MNVRRTLTWIAVAALGVGLTTAMTIATTLLSQQPIALASEPLSAGDPLVAPKVPAPVSAGPAVRRGAKANLHHRITRRPIAGPPVATPRPVGQRPTTSVQAAAAGHASRSASDPQGANPGDTGSQNGAPQQEGDVQSGQHGADD